LRTKLLHELFSASATADLAAGLVKLRPELSPDLLDELAADVAQIADRLAEVHRRLQAAAGLARGDRPPS
jgi:hypothetical protein